MDGAPPVFRIIQRAGGGGRAAWRNLRQHPFGRAQYRPLRSIAVDAARPDHR